MQEDKRYTEAEELKEIVIGFFDRLQRVQEQINKEKERMGKGNHEQEERR